MLPESGIPEFNAARMFQDLERWEAENNLRKRRAAEAIAGIAPCQVCGHKLRFVEGPPEGIAACSHFEEQLKAECRADVSRSASSDLFGWMIYREDRAMWNQESEAEFEGDVPEPADGQPAFNLLGGVVAAIIGIGLLLIFSALARGADVKTFGATGDGVTDDTIAIQAAADDCKAKLRAIQPTGGSYMGSSPELFFPSGKYKVSAPIDFSGYQTIRGEDSIVVATDPAADVFRFNGCYRNLIEKMQFIGGGRQIAFANANVDMTKLTIRDCNFQGWTTAAVTAEGTGPDLHLSATLLIEASNFDGGTMLITRADSTQVTDCRHQFRGPTIVEGTASIQNKWTGGVLGLSNFTGTPAMPVVEGETTIGHWVENCGSVVAERCRFGGEFAGIPVIHDRGGPNLANPWMGRKIVIVDSQVSSGRDIWPESAPITLFGLPQCIRVVGCTGLVSNAIPVIRLGPGYDCAADVAKVTASAKTSLSMYSIVIQGNQFFVSQPIPAPLQPFVK